MATNYYPEYKKFEKSLKKGTVVPVYKEILADYETPVSTYLKLAHGKKYSYVLESVEGGERWGRYSFISWEPKLVFKSRGDKYSVSKPGQKESWSQADEPLAVLKELMESHEPVNIAGLPRFWGGAVGYVSYDFVRFFEKLPAKPKEVMGLNDSIFLINDKMVIFDHLSHTLKIVICVTQDKKLTPAKLYANALSEISKIEKELKKPLKEIAPKKHSHGKLLSNMSEKEFCSKVKRAKHYISIGDIIQTVFSQRFSRKTDSKPFDIYRALRFINPSPYMYFMNFDEFELIGSSPEILVRKEGNTAHLRPIAGTRPRGKTQEEEAELSRELLSDPKETAEHIMLVDLGRNDLARVCKPDTVRVPQLMYIEKYSHVIHIVSQVTGELEPGVDAFELFKACFPAGTVSGAPKVRAMEIIDELEPEARGPYAGAVGYFSFSGNMDMAINIRTIILKGKIAYAQAGAGIVADSVPEKEFQETKNKAAALFKALDMAERGLEI